MKKNKSPNIVIMLDDAVLYDKDKVFKSIIDTKYVNNERRLIVTYHPSLHDGEHDE